MSAAAGEVTLTRLRWWHLEDVLAIERDLFAERAWSAEAFWAELARPETRRYVLATVAGRVAGYAGLFTVGPEADVQTVAVARTAQRRGVAGAMLDDLLAGARRSGVSVVHLEVEASNEVATHLYQRRGFVSVGRRRGYYGPGRDAVLMSARLTGGERHGR